VEILMREDYEIHSNGEKDIEFKKIASNISPVINPCFIIQKFQEIYK
jgi:hypothetical protein